MRKIYRSAAFTLIEVVVVMAIIAILALMTLPFFASTTTRAQVEESMPLADFAKKAVDQYYVDSKYTQVPANNEAAKLPSAEKIVGNYVSAVTVVDGAVNLKFGNGAHPDIKDKQLTYRMAISKDAKEAPRSWICAARPVPDKMEVVGTNITNVPLSALPPKCR